MEFNIEERKQNPLFELHSANVAECSISFLAIILVVCVNQNFLNNKHFLFVIATIPENFVPLLEVQESREDELVSGAAPLSYPVGHLNITSMGLCPALLCCPTLWATSVSQVWVCVRRCSAVLPCRSPQYHKYGSVYGAARLSYPVGHLNITSMGLCPALLGSPPLWATSISQVWVCVRLCSAVLPCGPPQYHKCGSVSGAAPLSYPVGLSLIHI